MSSLLSSVPSFNPELDYVARGNGCPDELSSALLAEMDAAFPEFDPTEAEIEAMFIDRMERLDAERAVTAALGHGVAIEFAYCPHTDLSTGIVHPIHVATLSTLAFLVTGAGRSMADAVADALAILARRRQCQAVA